MYYTRVCHVRAQNAAFHVPVASLPRLVRRSSYGTTCGTSLWGAVQYLKLADVGLSGNFWDDFRVYGATYNASMMVRVAGRTPACARARAYARQNHTTIRSTCVCV